MSTVSVFNGHSGQLGHGRGSRVWSSPKGSVLVEHIDEPREHGMPYGASLGVPGSEGGGGRLIKVGAFVAIASAWYWMSL